MSKTYKIKTIYKERESIVEGSLEEIKAHFAYFIESGYSWNRKINKNPKTGPSLIKTLEQCEQEIRGGCYEQKYYELIK